MKTDSQSIFDGISQHIAIDPTTIRLLSDRVLLRDLGDAEMEGSIVVPGCSRERGVGKKGLLRLGVVVAVGPGDRYLEMGLAADGETVRRKLITTPCPHCAGSGQWFDIRDYRYAPCIGCRGQKRVPVTVPAQCKVGETVLYERRKEAEIYVNGERLSMVHAEQAILGVVE